MNTTTHPGMIETAKDKSVEVIEGTGNIVEKTVDTTAQIVTTTVKDTAKVAGDVGSAAKGLVVGAVEGIKDAAVKTEHATAAVAGGAFKAVGATGSAAVDAVRTTIHGDKAAPKETEPAAAKN